MTPPPATVAARVANGTVAAKVAGRPVATKAANGAAARPAGGSGGTRTRAPERTTRRTIAAPGTTPRRPRRISGPARAAVRTPQGAASAPSSPNPVAAPISAPPRAARSAAARAARSGATAAPTRRLRVSPRAPRLARLPRLALTPRPRERAEALLDRVVRGRAWIPVLAVALVGIVAMQVEVLKLGSSVGRSMDTAAELSGQIQQDRAQVSALASPVRIEQLATADGLTPTGPTDIHFVSARASVGAAIANITRPNPSVFAANLAAQRALDDTSSSAAAAAARATDAGVVPTAANSAATGATNTPQTSGPGATLGP